ncbi:MAG: thioredoxin family protein [Chitinivibrionales bacterium]
MAATVSTMLSLGTHAPEFSLPSTDGKIVSLDDFAESPVLLVAFICNHCPYVRHIREGFLDLINDYQHKGVAVVAINSNDSQAYPQDSPEKMREEARRYGYTFPYLYDETQDVARAYRAACTPDFYVFNDERKLVYRGQMDNSRPGNDIPVTGNDLRAALDAALAQESVVRPQKPSMGCNIKWRPGNEPDYYRSA